MVNFDMVYCIVQITLYDGEIGDSKIMRIESYLEVSPEVVYRVLTDHKRRSVWDNFVT